ncbi:MAG: orotate phosphoribosyltransferase [Deltaproteobacteria bacterium]|nr:MAG: orotate phosphoribosyltransferase [Deltaproteobacteria bacterium]
MKELIAQILMSINCLQVSPKNPFSYASGLKGPIYCDNRKALSHVLERKKIVEGLLQQIKDSGVKFDSVCGLATAGIPHAAWVAEKLDLPMIYVRGKAKEHGKKNQIEGDFKAGDKVILIEDLVNQGSSLRTAVEALQGAGLEPQACFCIVNYEMKAVNEMLPKLGISLYSLTDFTTILRVAKNTLNLTDKDLQTLKNWHDDPKAWSPA